MDWKLIVDNLVFLLFLFRGLIQLGNSLNVIPDFLITAYGGLLIIVFGLYFFSTKYVFYIKRHLIWTYLFLLYGIFELFFQEVTLKGVNDLLSYSMYFLVTIFLIEQGVIFRKKRIRVYILLFFTILFAQIVISKALHLDNKGLLGSILGHGNSANLFLAYLAIYFGNKRKWIVVSFILLLMMIIGGRTSLISAGVISVCLFLKNKIKVSFIKNSMTFTILSVGLFMFGYITYKGITSGWGESLGLPFIGGKAGELISLNSMKWRIGHWSNYLIGLGDVNSLLFGNGVGAHAPVSIPVYGQFYEVHNDFLKILYDFGLIGMIFFLVADINIGRLLIHHNKGLGTLVFYSYYIRYTYMFFDNTVTNFIDTFIFVYFIFLFSKKEASY